ncbi:MAG TPA: glycosyltransferase family 39 protein [Candidatus Angelobacter sp.]|nr:glycosyltransferase family 39 protein [Candidatus Angelobacter sp.]
MPAADALRPAAEPHYPPQRGSFPTARQFFALLLIYFTLQIIFRVLISSSLDLDESEQLVLTQKLSWGYGSQPPLYTWIQFLFFHVFGLSVFGLSLLKNILLFGTYLFTYLNARFITRSQACAMSAAASLLFIPQIAWESQRDLTHSVLSATMVCATLFCFLQLHARPSLRRYALFGLCAGLGVLSKYNFLLPLAALVIATLCTRQFRRLILDKRILLAGLIAALIVLPNALWALAHPHLALRAAGKFKIQEANEWLRAIVSGVKGLVYCSITFFAAFGVLYAIIFFKRPAANASATKNEYATLLLRMLGISYALIVLAIVVFRISDIRDRWLQPILILSPVLVIALLRDRLNATRLKVILALAGAVMVAVTVALHGRIIWAERLHRTQPWNRPYDALAKQLKGAISQDPVVITDTTLMAGNLRINLPDKIFSPPDLARLFVETNAPVALVWDAGGDPAARRSARNQSRDWPPPDNLGEFADQIGMKLDPSQAHYFSATFKFHKTRQMRIGVVSEK